MCNSGTGRDGSPPSNQARYREGGREECRRLRQYLDIFFLLYFVLATAAAAFCAAKEKEGRKETKDGKREREIEEDGRIVVSTYLALERPNDRPTFARKERYFANHACTRSAHRAAAAAACMLPPLPLSSGPNEWQCPPSAGAVCLCTARFI